MSNVAVLPHSQVVHQGHAFPECITQFLVPRLGPLWERMGSAQLSPRYQPIMNFTTLETIGYEGLIRGPEDSEYFAPQRLFALARELKLGGELEVLSAQLIVKHFVESNLSGVLFVNYSAAALIASLADEKLHDAFVEASGVDPDRVVIELTEHRDYRDSSALGDAVRKLRDRKGRLALDDFGTGVSNLMRWSALKPDYVKIDKYFIGGIAASSTNQDFVHMIVQMAARLGTGLIAEGIENVDDLDCLTRLGVTIGQGYLFVEPQVV